ncbi:hypothetical protein E4U17_003529 [Claviceps sp. LM77 group G4]|nr:hypothetical protein E4U17_003529 [Claviceps sp. LM77 group G4]KAG6068569.1 hypothetical protein E4U16_007934 [Claviceps sp. LM84 group G4]KAG6079782.1 hypothetical protein E4U33_008109 [Claviceps sp. LM78 group G4]
MPSDATSSDTWSRRDSYPPTQIRLSRCNKNEPRPLLQEMDENPLTYFLTPSGLDINIKDFDAEDLLFDAGIEDSNHPRECIRSVSPSTLDGLSKMRAKAVSPDFDAEIITTDDDDDDEEEEEEDEDDYIRFPAPSPSRRSRSKGPENARSQCKISPVGRSRATSDGFLSTGTISSPSSPTLRATPRGRPRQSLAQRYSGGKKASPRPLQLWREPSLDVWPISEETEEDVLSMEKEESEVLRPAIAQAARGSLGRGPTMKPKKRVRFLLTPSE